MRNEVALIYGRIKNKVRNMLYELFLWKYGFGNRVSKVTWEKQFSSGSWAHLFNPQESAHYTSIARMVKNQDLSVKILDVGCGQGVLYGYLQKDNQSINYLGIDISNEAISQAKEKFKGKRFQNLDFENNTISEKFDIIIFN
ncbi:MAG: class I SAM-dependent methyltransferase, partial [Pedobacter sp.]